MNRVNNWLVVILFVSLALGQLTRLSLWPGVNLYLFDLIAVILVLNYHSGSGAPAGDVSPGVDKILPPKTGWFIAAAILSLLVNLSRFSLDQLLVSSLYLVRFVVYALLYPVLIKIKPKKTLLLLPVLVAGFGLIQYLLMPDTRFLAQFNWDDHYYRLISSFLDPNFVGLILVLGLIFIWVKLAQLKYRWPLSLLIFVALLLTYSRSSYLSLLAAALTYSWLKRKFSVLIFALCILSFAFLLPRPGGEGVKLERVYSLWQRQDDWRQAVSVIKTSPVFGVGFNTLRFIRRDFTSHAASGFDSSLLFVASTTGIIGFLAYLNLLKHFWQQSLLLKISLAAALVHSLFQNSLFYPQVMIWFWAILAL